MTSSGASPGGPGEAARLFDWAAAAYVLMIASGALACLDIISYGVTAGGRIIAMHPLNRFVWPLAYLVFAFLTLRRLSEITDAALRCWWILPVPIVAAGSVLWSLDPTTSANGALRLTVSAIIGIYVGATFSLPAITRLVFWLLLVVVGLSVLVSLAGLDFAIMFDGKARGILYHKNQLGNRAVILIAASLALWSIERRLWLSLPGILVACIALVLARSATSFITALAVVATIALLMSLHGPALAIALRCALIGAAVTVAGALLIVGGIDPLAAVFDALDRDPTLTGRSLLWEAARAQIERRPLLGTGYEAFWASAVDWRTLQVLERMGQVGHFHNTLLEVGVQLGVVGILAAMVTLVVFVWRGLELWFKVGSPSAIWPLAFGAAVLVPSLAEYELFAKHSFTGILMVATAVAGVRTLDHAGQPALGAARWPRQPAGERAIQGTSTADL